MRLWLRVALVTAVVSIASLLLTGVVAMRVAGEAATNTALRAQERDASAVAASVDRWLRDRKSTLLGWALAFPLAELDGPRRTGLVRGVLGAIPSAVVVTIVDGDGQAVVESAYFTAGSAPPGAIAGSPERAERLVRALPVTAALGSASGAAIGSPYRVGSRPMVPVAVVASVDPPLLLGVELSLDIVEEFAARSDPDRVVALLDDRGQRLSDDSPLLQPRMLTALLGTVASITYDVGGVTLQGAVAPVPSTGWSVVVLEPAAVALEGPRRIRFLLPFVVGGAMALAVLLGLVLGRTVTQPIARLQRSVLAVAEGRLGVRAEVAGPGEVVELARSFNHMSARLLDNQEEIERQRAAIEAFNQDLQSEIESATRDLRGAQAQLVRSGQLAAVAQIAAGLAHELNNPLTAVLGLTQLLSARTLPADLHADLADLEREALRCREVVDALLRLSVDGQMEADSCVLTELLDEVFSLVDARFTQRGVDLQRASPLDVSVALPRTPTAHALAQLLDGLAAGLPGDSRVNVTTTLDGEVVVVNIQPSIPVAVSSDDWMASGIEVWVARQTLDRLGADLVEPLEDHAPWVVRLPAASGT